MIQDHESLSLHHRDDYCKCTKPDGVYGKFGRHLRPSTLHPQWPVSDVVVGSCSHWREVQEGIAEAKKDMDEAQAQMDLAKREGKAGDAGWYSWSGRLDSARDKYRDWRKTERKLKGDRPDADYAWTKSIKAKGMADFLDELNDPPADPLP